MAARWACASPEMRDVVWRMRGAAAVYLRQLAAIGVLEEVKVGREKLFVNPRLMRLLTVEEPGDLSLRAPRVAGTSSP
jgi:hypothetical protein